MCTKEEIVRNKVGKKNEESVRHSDLVQKNLRDFDRYPLSWKQDRFNFHTPPNSPSLK